MTASSFQTYRERRRQEAAAASLKKRQSKLYREKRTPASLRGYKSSHYHTIGDLEVIWRLQEGRCYYTGESLGGRFESRAFHVDHILPLVRGGSDEPTNLALTLPQVNRQKSDMTKEEFLGFIRVSAEAILRMDAIDLGRRIYFKDQNRNIK